MKTPVTSVYRAPANTHTLTIYDFVIGHELPNTNIIIINSAKKRTRPRAHQGFSMRHLKNMHANGARARWLWAEHWNVNVK